MNTLVLKGNIIYSRDKEHLVCMRQSYLICENGISQGVYEKLPEKYEYIPVTDYGDKVILPGLSDLHTHAPQYAMRANGMDMELLDWLNTYTFPVESRYQDLEYAKAAYGQYVKALKESATTRACIFGTIHNPATLLLMEMLEDAGIRGYVGKVNMDRNSPDFLREESAKKSLEDTREWLRACDGRFKNIKPILTPRFIPNCTKELLYGLGEIQKETVVPLQSHLSENHSEIAWVKALCPEAANYADAYDRFGLFGNYGKTVMAHCVHSTEEEISLMKERSVFVAHCALSNMNLSSGATPVRTYLEQGIHVGLGTDMAGGYAASVFHAMADSVQASKLRWCLLDKTLKPLSAEEVFFMGTLGGGAFFGKTGSFEKGYECDAVVIDDGRLLPPHKLDLRERLERIIYLSDERDIVGKYLAGESVRTLVTHFASVSAAP